MKKRSALLIGVSEYGEGFDPLSGSLRDVQEIEQALKDPDCGAYELTCLQNKENGILNTQIENFFRNRDKDDLLLFYFSGHGDLGAGGFANQQLHLCARNSKKDNGVLIESTAVSAAFLKRQMDNCRAKNIIVILDCCYSGAIADLLKKGEEEIDFKALKAEGRVILASSSASQVALQEPEGLSLYTKYLIEGMHGAAPFEDKWIKARQLHDYADRRFEVERRGGYRPKIIADDTGYNLPIVRAPKPDPRLEYFQKVDQIYQRLDDKLHLKFDGVVPDPSIDRGRFETCPARRQISDEEAKASALCCAGKQA